ALRPETLDNALTRGPLQVRGLLWKIDEDLALARHLEPASLLVEDRRRDERDAIDGVPCELAGHFESLVVDSEGEIRDSRSEAHGGGGFERTDLLGPRRELDRDRTAFRAAVDCVVSRVAGALRRDGIAVAGGAEPGHAERLGGREPELRERVGGGVVEGETEMGEDAVAEGEGGFSRPDLGRRVRSGRAL